MFKKKLLLFNTKSSLKNAKSRDSIGFKNAKNVGVIFSIEDLNKHKSIKTFIKTLEEEGKTVQVLSYLGKGKDNHEFLFDFFTDEDISMWGKQQNEIANRFTENKFDFLFHLDINRNDMIENILAKSNAKCRIGIINNDEESNQFYELMLHPSSEQSFDLLLEEILHFVKKIIGNGK